MPRKTTALHHQREQGLEACFPEIPGRSNRRDRDRIRFDRCGHIACDHCRRERSRHHPQRRIQLGQHFAEITCARSRFPMPSLVCSDGIFVFCRRSGAFWRFCAGHIRSEHAVIARSSATKQSRPFPRRQSGLLRFARNDGAVTFDCHRAAKTLTKPALCVPSFVRRARVG